LPALPHVATRETTCSSTPSSSSDISIQFNGQGAHFQAQAPIPEHSSSWTPAQWTHSQWPSQQWIPEPTGPHQAHSPLSPNEFDTMSDYPMDHASSFSGLSQNNEHVRHEGHFIEEAAHIHHPSVEGPGSALTSVPFVNPPDETGEWNRLQFNSRFPEAPHASFQASSYASTSQYQDWAEPTVPYQGAMIERKPENSATLHAHNQVEKRYRINLNRKIAMLRDSVPSIRRHASASEDDECSNPLISRSDAETDRNQSKKTPMASCSLPPPVNKATVMEEATKYIKTLEHSVRVLQKEQVQMRNELMHYRKMAMSSSEGESPGTRCSPNKISK
jgi:hypothetical protein